MAETRKIAAILVADIVGYSRLAGADEERTLARLRALRSDLFDPTIAVHHGRIVKRTGDGALVEFRSVVDAVRCAVEVQKGMVERNAGLPEDRRIEFRIGVHLGDVVEEADDDLMGDGVNVAARLEGVAAPGGICLSEDAWRQVKGRIDLPAEDLGPIPLKNIAEPIRVFALAVDGQSSPKAPAPPAEAAPRLSIVVLPFLNLGGGPEQDHFVDGITESLTSDLSRISGAFVIARNTAFTYKGKAVDVREIGRDLNVRYVLEGSVQRGGARMRVSVQLIDAGTGSHLWSERFDKPVADLFDMQDEIVSRLANRLGQELAVAEARRAEGVVNPNSMDHYFLGLALYHRNGAEFLHQAREHFDRALELDPDNVDALVRRAWVEVSFVVAWLPEDRARAAEPGRSRSPQGPAAEAGKRGGACGARRALHEQRPRRTRHRRMRTRARPRPEFGDRSCVDRHGKVLFRPRGRDGGTHSAGAQDQPARRLRQRLDGLRRLREIRRGQGRGGGRLGEPLDRHEPRLHDLPFPSRRRVRGPRTHGGSARSRPCRARPQPDLHHRPLPGLPVQRQSPLPRRPRAHPRRPTQGRRA